jgi:hypothetical protein
VDEPAEPAIRQSRAYAARARDGYLPLTVVEGRLATARATGKACTFLRTDSLCELHSELGGERKPLVCQTYPYLLTETPDGIYAALSYACPAALESTGPGLEQSRADLESLIASRWREMPQGPPIGPDVEILRGRFLLWKDYQRLEADILEAFDSLHPVQSLLGTAVHLVLAEPLDSSEGGLSWKDLAAPYNFGGFDQQLACMVSCNLIAIIEDVIAPDQRAQLGSFLWNGGRHRSLRFDLVLPAFQLALPRTDYQTRVIARYLRNAVFGKRLLAGTVVSRLLALACGLAILLFYTEAFSQCDDEPVALDRAFTLVESELLSHTRSFDGFFVEFEEALRNVRDGLRG